MSNEITIKVDLTDESKKLLKAVAESAKAIAAASSGKPKAASKKPAEDESFDDVDGDADADDGDDVDGDADADDGEDEGPTRDQVQSALRAYAGVSSKAAALKLLKEKGGTDALSKLKPAKFDAVIKAANAATKATKAAKAKK